MISEHIRKYIMKHPNPEQVKIVFKDNHIHAILDAEGNSVDRVVGLTINQNGIDVSTVVLRRHWFKYNEDLGLYDPEEYEQECTVIGFEVI